MNRKSPPPDPADHAKAARKTKKARTRTSATSTPINTTNDMTIIQFYSKSKDINDLGKLGVGPHDSSLDYISNWRKVLSNFWESDIVVDDNKKYPSVEHYFHASKAKCSNRPQYALEFETHKSIGRKSPLDAKRAGSKTGFNKVGAILNVALWNAQRDAVVTRALQAKARSDPLFVKILLASRQRNLYLLHFERGGSKSYWGGSISKQQGPNHGKQVGRNRLGELLMSLREELATAQNEDEDEEEEREKPAAVGAGEEEKKEEEEEEAAKEATNSDSSEEES